MTIRHMANGCSLSPLCTCDSCTLRPPAQGHRHSPSEARTAKLSARQDQRKPLWFEAKYRGGPELWVEIKARGGVWRVPGHRAIFDVLAHFNGALWVVRDSHGLNAK
jgi:hypothetical protein